MTFCFSVTSSTEKSKQFSGHLCSDFAGFCAFVFSHPLYLSYFLFFSPYLFKLLSFLSPLFITTALLLLSLLTSIIHDSTSVSKFIENLWVRFDEIGGEEDEESKELLCIEEFEVYKIVFGAPTFELAREYPDGETGPDGLSSDHGSSEENPVEFSRKFEGESCMGENPGEEIEEKVLGVLISDSGDLLVECQENPVEISGEVEGKSCETPRTDRIGENPGEEEEEEEEKILGVLISDDGDLPAKCQENLENPVEFPGKRQDDERLEELSVQETAKSEKLTCGVGKAAEENPTMADMKCSKVLTEANQNPMELTPSSFNGGDHTQQKLVIKTHSRRHGLAVWNSNDGHTNSLKHHDYSSSPSQSLPVSPSLSNPGSMRKEKEWRRTLACKLFEERHNVSGAAAACGGGGIGGRGEGMDLLWEAYEKKEENKVNKPNSVKKKEKEKNKKKSSRVVDYVEDSDDEDEEEDEEEDNGQLCCLQALKFSAGKMNFGVGKPGFMKISKAFKGIGVGWLSHQRHTGGSKKGKNI